MALNFAKKDHDLHYQIPLKNKIKLFILPCLFVERHSPE